MVLGIVGGIGSGKSTVAGLLEERGAVVYDADAACHRLLERGDIAARVAGVLDLPCAPEGRIDRGRLADRVFGDPAALSLLEEVLHPIVKEEILRKMAEMNDRGVLALDAPLLFEAGLDEFCDLVVFVDVPEQVRRERLAGREISDLARREGRQIPLEEKRARSQATIDNSGDVAATREGVARLWGKLRACGGDADDRA